MPADLIGGLTELADTILGQAGAIVKMRIKAETDAAGAEIGLLNARFLAGLQSIDPETGQYKIAPEQYESVFADHKTALEGFSDRLNFAPAKRAVQAIATQGLPELYLSGAQEMNKQQIQLAGAAWTRSFLAPDANPLLSAQEWYDSKMEAIVSGKTNAAVDPVELSKLEASIQSQFKIKSVNESLDLVATEQGIPAATAEARAAIKTAGLDRDEGHAVLADLQARQQEVDDTTRGKAWKVLADSPNDYIDKSRLEAFLGDKNISEGTKAAIKDKFDGHNIVVLGRKYRNQINNEKWYTEKGITNLQKIRDEIQADRNVSTGGDEFVSDPEEVLRGQLLDDIDGKISAYANAEARKAAADDDDSVVQMTALISGIKANRTVGPGEPKPFADAAYAEGSALVQLMVLAKRGGNKAASTLKEGIETLFPDMAPAFLEEYRNIVAIADKDPEVVKDQGLQFALAGDYDALYRAAKAGDIEAFTSAKNAILGKVMDTSNILFKDRAFGQQVGEIGKFGYQVETNDTKIKSGAAIRNDLKVKYDQLVGDEVRAFEAYGIPAEMGWTRPIKGSLAKQYEAPDGSIYRFTYDKEGARTLLRLTGDAKWLPGDDPRGVAGPVKPIAQVKAEEAAFKQKIVIAQTAAPFAPNAAPATTESAVVTANHRVFVDQVKKLDTAGKRKQRMADLIAAGAITASDFKTYGYDPATGAGP
jgi:YD repeat-containing protein